MLTPTDQELARSARDGDKAAFGDLVERYQSSVFNVCYRLLGERREAEDLAQEAFIRAYQRFHLFDPQRPFGPWIRRVAANLCFNHMQVLRHASLELEDETEEGVEAPAQQPESARLAAENAEAIRKALQALPPHYRAVIELRHFHEMPYSEIAAFLKIPLSDVKSHLFRARHRLAGLLRQYAE